MKKTFDSVAFMRKRREELSRAYDGLSWQQIEKKIKQTLKNNPLWMQKQQRQSLTSSRKITKHL